MYNPIYPSVVLKIFKDGCQKPFSLFLLTDKYVLSPEASKPVGEKLLIGQGNTLYMQATDPSPLVRGLPETELTYSQYMQAMPHFIELHREFHGDDLAQPGKGISETWLMWNFSRLLGTFDCDTALKSAAL
ncbi:hypothetical protein OPQ81_002811 [Rhizoctonia solani]|nr:hypothetical protein OPQ81_002811 [Rhizoctonia solani]